MSGYEKLDVYAFGQQLIDTEDLDPVYSAVACSGMDEPQLARWLLAYWCFYHTGVSSFLSEHEGPDYWKWMTVAAKNEDGAGPHKFNAGPGLRWPRGTERRHFRGQKCVDAVDWFATGAVRGKTPAGPLLEPESYVRRLLGLSTEKNVMDQVQSWPLFGPWIAFKAADMMERCYGDQVSFDPNIGLLYSEPAKALRMLIDLPEDPSKYNTCADAYQQLLEHWDQTPAPPAYGRARLRNCGPQEIETVLCKWKSHMGGHYPIGKDLHEVRLHLEGWGSTAEKMLERMPKEVVR